MVWLTILLTFHAAADSNQPAPPSFVPNPSDTFTLTLYFENDGTFARPHNQTDRHYTNGAGFSIAFQPEWARTAADSLPRLDAGSALEPLRAAFGIVVGQLIFTPEDLTAPIPDPDDHPYAGYLFVGGYLQRSAKYDGYATLDHLQLDLGVVGPSSRAEQIQNEDHRIFDEVDPKGWDAQLKDEPTFQVTFAKKWRFAVADFALAGGPWRIEAIPSLRLRAGTVHLDAELGVQARIGFNVPDGFGPGFLLDPGDATHALAPRGWSLYAFGGASVRFVGHNLVLEGGTFRSGPSVDSEPVVGRVSLGTVLSYRTGSFSATLGYAQAFMSDEFETQRGSDGLGQIGLALRWEY